MALWVRVASLTAALRGITTGGVNFVRGRRPRRAWRIVAGLPASSPATEMDHLAGGAPGTGGGGRTIAAPGEGLQGDVAGLAGSAEPGGPVQRDQPVKCPAGRSSSANAGGSRASPGGRTKESRPRRAQPAG